ncbi:MAG: polymorphic toxin type 44 domain-containing protein [Pseudomonadota bacterium]
MAFPPLPAMTFAQLTDYLHGEMVVNALSSDARLIRRCNEAGAATLKMAFALSQALPLSLRAPVTVGPAMGAEVSGTAAAMLLWYDKVAAGRDWDHKGRLKPNNAWIDDGARSFRFDIWSNLHYGFVGRAVAFSAWTLRSGAGAAQVKDKTVPDGYWDRRFKKVGDVDVFSAFDDPDDQAAIMIGADLYDAKGPVVTVAELRAMVRARASTLATKPAKTP